jgi:putative membrane protein
VILPAIDAVLNGASAVCLCAGFYFIKQKNVVAHKRCMLGAFLISCAFLAVYLIHHAQVGSVPYRGQGWLRTLYFAILIPHIVLAAAVVPLAIATIRRGLSRRVPEHRRIARWTLPIWLYVSLSGIAVYLMLYRL